MRTIKFRGKRVDNGKWVYGYYTKHSDKESGVLGVENDYFWITDKNGDIEDVFEDSVGQFTGLPSQDKEDIYEGDRLFDYDDDYYVVEFSEGRFAAVGDGFEVDLFEIADRCSIIGNIHDNKELLND